MKLPLIFSGALLLSACGTPTLGPSQSRTAPLDAETLSLSCSELATRNNRIAQRLQQLEAESQARARRNAVTDTMVNTGLGVLLGASARGGVDGIRAASATVQGIESVRAAERGQASMQNVSDVLALAGRSSELQRAMIEQGC